MRLIFITSIFISSLSSNSIHAFAPISSPRTWGSLSSSSSSSDSSSSSSSSSSTSLNSSTTEAISGAGIKAKLEAQMEKMRERDRGCAAVAKEDLKVIYQDEHIVIVDKPSGVLCVPGKTNDSSSSSSSSLNSAVFESFGCESNRMDKMVVHRLGIDTSGLVVFARTDEALRNMNTMFRTRRITRRYEVLVCGNVEEGEEGRGEIDMPLMRDYEFPPYMRVSTDEHQKVLMDLSEEDVGKKLLEQPKESLTRYEVVSKEELDGFPVTRLSLTSVSGRTHQLNVHCAAFGHPIVADRIYGVDGEAAPNGGYTEEDMDELAPNRASLELQRQIASAVGDDKNMCVHAKSIEFDHPVTGEKMSFESEASF